MIPKYLTSNPFPESQWSPNLRPVAVLDGVPFSINSLSEPVSADISYFVGVNQKTFEKVIGLVSSRVMHFYEMRVADISSISQNTKLQELAVHWNSKLEDISPLADVHNLKSLVLEDTPKIYDLSPLEKCLGLECLEYSGGMWKKNNANSLEYISHLPKLKHLRLLNLGVDSHGLKPLANLSVLEELELSNQFPTEDYAYLSVHLKSTECEYFFPYVEMSGDIDGKDVMVIGSRKPFLNKVNDSKKLEKYVKQFDELKAKFTANKASQPTPKSGAAEL